MPAFETINYIDLNVSNAHATKIQHLNRHPSLGSYLTNMAHYVRGHLSLPHVGHASSKRAYPFLDALSLR